MDRRSALKQAMLLTGATFSTAFVTGFFSGCKPETVGSTYQSIFFDQDKFQFLSNLADVIIPETDTPGALKLGVPEWIDTMIKKAYTPENQNHFNENFQLVYNAFNQGGSVDQLKDNIKELEASKEDGGKLTSAFKNLKGMIAAGYLGTEYVGKNLLNYLPVPGEFESCIPLSSTNGKAWTI